MIPPNPNPFPVVVGPIDCTTAGLLAEDHASAASEMTALTSYFYQHTIAPDGDFADTMLQIAKEEMTHLEHLGEAIVTLGGDPRYYSNAGYWHAMYTDYERDMRTELLHNIAAEEAAIAQYRAHIAATPNESVKALLARIIEDEERHIDYFYDQLQSLGG